MMQMGVVSMGVVSWCFFTGIAVKGWCAHMRIMCKILLDRAELARHMNMISEHCRNRYYLEYQSAFKIRKLRRCHCDEGSFPLKWLVALRGFSLRGFWEVPGFPCSGGKELQNCPHRPDQPSVRSSFPPAKGKPGTSQKPLRENPLSATNDERISGISECL